MIDLDAPDPLYVQVANVLRARITDGTYTGRMPSEAQLSDEFDLSRPTIRQALAVLADEGLVRAVRGRGTFATPPTD